MIKNAFFICIGLALVIWSFAQVWRSPTREPVLKINGKEIVVEVADTPVERSQGLSGRDTLEPGHGLLFIFEEPGNYGFWMKEMKFSIDIIWLDEEFQVVGIERSVLPESYPHVFYPPVPIKYVVETNPGEL